MLTKDTSIGFVGTGVMGKSMARNLHQAGYTINIYTRTKEKAKELLELGAAWKSSVAELASSSDVIITMFGYPVDVEEVYFGENGILENAKADCFVIDMTTSKPSLAKTIYQKAKERDIHALDAPVSGGDVGAKNGKLSIMVGGNKEAFQHFFHYLK